MDTIKARQTLERRERELVAENHVLWKRASADAERILEKITAGYDLVRVWQWGSVLEPEMFRKGSDIDFAVEGVPDAPTWFRLLGDAMDLTDFPLDIVQLEKIAPEFADIIRMKGKVVYER